MKKIMIMIMVVFSVAMAFSGDVGLPTETIAFPHVDGEAIVCVWDLSAEGWLLQETADSPASYSFKVPEWNKWYWVALWDKNAREYVSGKWITHFES